MSEFQTRLNTEIALGVCILDFLTKTRAHRTHTIVTVSPDVIVNIVGSNKFEEIKLNGVRLNYRGIHVVSDDKLPEGTCLAHWKH